MTDSIAYELTIEKLSYEDHAGYKKSKGHPFWIALTKKYQPILHSLLACKVGYKLEYPLEDYEKYFSEINETLYPKMIADCEAHTKRKVPSWMLKPVNGDKIQQLKNWRIQWNWFRNHFKQIVIHKFNCLEALPETCSVCAISADDIMDKNDRIVEENNAIQLRNTIAVSEFFARQEHWRKRFGYVPEWLRMSVDFEKFIPRKSHFNLYQPFKETFVCENCYTYSLEQRCDNKDFFF